MPDRRLQFWCGALPGLSFLQQQKRDARFPIRCDMLHIKLNTSCGVSVFKMSVVCSAAWFCYCRRHAAASIYIYITRKGRFCPKVIPTNRLSNKVTSHSHQMFSIGGPCKQRIHVVILYITQRVYICETRKNKIDVKWCARAEWAE